MIWLTDETTTGITSLSPSGSGSNDNEGALHTPESFRTRALPSDAVEYHTKDILQRSSRQIL